jgi:hypothetical protein
VSDSPYFQRFSGPPAPRERQQIGHCLQAAFSLPLSDNFGDLLQAMNKVEERATDDTLETV